VKAVTLLVTPRQAETIELASQNGRPRLVLRGDRDESDIASSGVNSEQLLAIPPDPTQQTQQGTDASLEERIMAAIGRVLPPTQPVAQQPTAAPVDPRTPVEIIRGGKQDTIYVNPGEQPRSANEEQRTAADGTALLPGTNSK
jgi:hypothetical protein